MWHKTDESCVRGHKLDYCELIMIVDLIIVQLHFAIIISQYSSLIMCLFMSNEHHMKCFHGWTHFST
jgi:hypothetical protein